jgi:hypothetical protein
MIGLFVDHEGMERNNPLARFGNISMVASKSTKVMRVTRDGRQILQISHIVDMHSRTGFSGSPVFVYRTFASDLTEFGEQVKISTRNFPRHDDRRERRDDGASFDAEIRSKRMLLLLGIHWGQFRERYGLQPRTSTGAEVDDGPSRFFVDGAYVAGYSGMTLVVPACKILGLLELPSLEEKRAQAEATMVRGPESGAVEE